MTIVWNRQFLFILNIGIKGLRITEKIVQAFTLYKHQHHVKSLLSKVQHTNIVVHLLCHHVLVTMKMGMTSILKIHCSSVWNFKRAFFAELFGSSWHAHAQFPDMGQQFLETVRKFRLAFLTLPSGFHEPFWLTPPLDPKSFFQNSKI